MTGPRLNAWERERLAVLRLTVVAADPTADRIAVRRGDLVTMLAAVDRLAETAQVISALSHFHGGAAPSFIAGTMFIFGGASIAADRPGDPR